MDGSLLWASMLDFAMSILGFIFVVVLGAIVGFAAGAGLGFVAALPFQEEKRESIAAVFAVIGGISTVVVGVYWIYF